MYSCVQSFSLCACVPVLCVPCACAPVPALSALPLCCVCLPCGSAAWVLDTPLYKSPVHCPLYTPLFSCPYTGVLYGGGLFLSPATVLFIFLRISASLFLLRICIIKSRPCTPYWIHKKSACIFRSLYSRFYFSEINFPDITALFFVPYFVGLKKQPVCIR